MKKLKTDNLGCSAQIRVLEIKEENDRQYIVCGYNSSQSSLLRHNDDEESENKKKSLISPDAAQKCHKNVTYSRVTGKQMDIHRRNISLFRNSSFVIGILLGLMCCGSLHAKGKTKHLIIQ